MASWNLKYFPACSLPASCVVVPDPLPPPGSFHHHPLKPMFSLNSHPQLVHSREPMQRGAPSFGQSHTPQPFLGLLATRSTVTFDQRDPFREPPEKKKNPPLKGRTETLLSRARQHTIVPGAGKMTTKRILELSRRQLRLP